MKYVIATNNKGKLAEIRAILAPLGIEATGQRELGISIEAEENGATFAENAQIKAEAVMRAAGLPAIADDSGLCVDALDGRPGIYSARYAGEGASDSDRMAKLLSELRDVPEERRTARFVCAMCAAYPDGRLVHIQEQCEGVILREQRGTDGFGYDPVFYLPDCGMTFAELPEEKKNEVSHRGKALRKLAQQLV